MHEVQNQSADRKPIHLRQIIVDQHQIEGHGSDEAHCLNAIGCNLDRVSPVFEDGTEYGLLQKIIFHDEDVGRARRPIPTARPFGGNAILSP